MWTLSLFQPINVEGGPETHAFCVVYSQTDLNSFRKAEEELHRLYESEYVSSKAVILVANKTDLVRGRVVSTEGEKKKEKKMLELRTDQ